MGPCEQLAQKDAWGIEKLSPGQKRNARSRSLERRRPESRTILEQEKLRLSIGNARELPSIHDNPLRPLEEEHIKAVATEVPGITSGTIEMQGVTNETGDNEKRMAERIIKNEQKTIDLHHQLQHITTTANRLTESLQKALGQISSQQELHRTNLFQHEDCLSRGRNLLEEQRQFNILTQQQSGATQQRMDQYEEVMEELDRESRTIHDSTYQQVQQGQQNQQAQASHEAETVRLKEELSQMKNDNFRRREFDGGKSSRCPQSVVMDNLVPPPFGLNRPQQTWNASEQTGQGAPDSHVPRINPSLPNHYPPTNSGDRHAPEPPARHYPQGFGATNHPVFVPIPSHESFPAFTPAMYSNWRRGIKLWLSAQHGIPVTHIIARIIAVLP